MCKEFAVPVIFLFEIVSQRRATRMKVFQIFCTGIRIFKGWLHKNYCNFYLL